MGSAVAVGAAAVLAGVGAAPASSAGAGTSAGRQIAVVTSGLAGPFGLKSASGHGGLLVAEGLSGNVTRVFLDGRKRTILPGVGGVAGVAGGPGRVFAVTGEAVPPGQEIGPSRVVRMGYNGGNPTVIANLLRHELRHNPDGQDQFNDQGEPFDALSNPFAMEWSRFGLFVADGGANDVLKVNPRTGRVRTFFAPRTFKDTPECRADGANANPGTRGCDPVATGVQVRGRSVYVSFLGAHQPGAGRVYKLDARTGKVQRIWKHFSSPTGVAVGRGGTVFVSQVEHGAPPNPEQPPAGFDFATVGQITRIKGGHRTQAQVTMPTGMTFRGGKLFSTAWSTPFIYGQDHPGEVVRVQGRAFR